MSEQNASYLLGIATVIIEELFTITTILTSEKDKKNDIISLCELRLIDLKNQRNILIGKIEETIYGIKDRKD